MATAQDVKPVDQLLREAAALQAARRLGEAEALHRAVLAQAPATLPSLQFLSARSFERGEVDAARAYLERALALDPADLEARRVASGLERAELLGSLASPRDPQAANVAPTGSDLGRWVLL